MHRKPILLLSLLISLLALLCSCASSGIPVAEDAPDATLPPASVSYVAPIGDAALEYTADATLYLPRHDGMRLTTVTAQVPFSSTRPHAESLVRALLSYAGDGEASPVGGSVRLSLYGVNPVEISRDVATVNLAATALQLSRESLYLACQAITNTLTSDSDIRYVNFLVADKPVGLDIANTLPMGAMNRSGSDDISAAYEQRLSRRVESGESAADKSLSSNVTLYFPLSGTEGIASEVRTISFSDQVLSNMVVAILRELAQGPQSEDIASPALPLLAELLTSDPELITAVDTGNSILSLEFAYNLDDMLEGYGLTRTQSMASLCYTLCTYFPSFNGIRVKINNEPVDALALSEEADVSIFFQDNTLLRADFATLLYDYATLHFPDAEGKLRASQRPLPYSQCTNPRVLLSQLGLGPQAFDSVEGLMPVISGGALLDTDVLGVALAEDTLLVNFAPSFLSLGAEMNEQEERLLAYSIVNTLCSATKVKSVCIFVGGSQFDGFSGGIYWQGVFYPLTVS